MSSPSELSFDEILKFMLAHNGKVTNHQLVKHFKTFLTNPDTREEARYTFKKHVNTLASIKIQNNEKCLILKRKYLPVINDDISLNIPPNDSMEVCSPNKSVETDVCSPEPPKYRPVPPIPVEPDYKEQNVKQPMGSQYFEGETISSPKFDESPLHYLRKKSLISPDVCENDLKSPNSSVGGVASNTDTDSLATSQTGSVTSLVEPDQTVSVKERKQMFNKMASDVVVLRPRQYGHRGSIHGVDEDDRASLISRGDSEPLDARQKLWILCAARGDYHALAKLCKDYPKLVTTKDPFTTAMHWACKRGDENVVKMLAGMTRRIVNERSGYTPLHIAMQFQHLDVYKLLIEVYDADANARDWSGRKPRQYLQNPDAILSPDAYRKFKVKADKKNFEKEGFLRIGSLNVRVKKTTEAFSNFLGVGATRSSAYIPKSSRFDVAMHREEPDQLHKNWGSADNITKPEKLMPPPSSSKVRKRGVSGRLGIVGHSRSTPSTPDQARAAIGLNAENDSDSDSAAGFHEAWRSQRNSNAS